MKIIALSKLIIDFINLLLSSNSFLVMHSTDTVYEQFSLLEKKFFFFGQSDVAVIARNDGNIFLLIVIWALATSQKNILQDEMKLLINLL